MQTRSNILQHCADRSVPARDRITRAAEFIFFLHGVHAPLREITHLAGSNDVTAIKHFGNRETLVLHFIKSLIDQADATWTEATSEHPGQPEAQLRNWIGYVGRACSEMQSEQCQLARAAAELKRSKKSPLLDKIEVHRRLERLKVAELCSLAGLREPDVLAEKLILLIDGARNERDCFGWPRICSQLCDAADDLMVVHGAVRKLPLE